MKSLGLALTIFSLTAALAALDMSGAHHVGPASTPAAPLKANAPAYGAMTSATGTAASTEDDDDADPLVINAFLVLPRLTPPVATTPVTEVRYD